MPVFCRGVLH